MLARAALSDRGGPARGVRAWLVAVGMLAFGFGAGPAGALPVYDTDATGELIGSRDTDAGGGLTGFGQWASAFTISWDIDLAAGPGVVHYTYLFTGLDGSGQEKEVSNFVLDISDDCDGDALCVYNVEVNGSALDPGDLDFGDFNGIVGAVKFDVGGGEGITYEFDSNRLPVYGHLAMKDGGGSGVCPNPGSTTAACSDGLVAGFDTGDTLDYIARPDGMVSAPEPGTALLTLAFVSAWAARRRR